ncbi:proline-rich receptor-like protein kinase PERK8 [Hevea brasiliensis]|uniref:proline-rich receptor-like protein kinase PERK8 n=1 Tax=Hevea brasiliensis TaxID=3981 RepID=UPI0025EB5EAF|nr:proline-rich receptor-like protein kinase PERK8 [Hevea brasiliensis]
MNCSDGGSTLPALQPLSSPHRSPVIDQIESSSIVQDQENQGGGSTLPALQPVSSPHHSPVIDQIESNSAVQDQENQDGGSTLPALQPVSSPHHSPVIGQIESSSVVQDQENQDGGSMLPTPQPTSPPHHSPVIHPIESSSVVEDKENQGHAPTSKNHQAYELKKYSFEQLAAAAGQFSNNFLLGEGAFGQVYEGKLHGKVVAIKKLKITQDEQHEKPQKNLEEIEVLRNVGHPHIVKLDGYCNEEANKLLVLEYVPNKSLNFHLHVGKELLEWENRMKIAVGSAKGIQYLHEGCDPKIIHRDIKSANILIDNEFQPKVADFSLAIFLPISDDITHISSSMMKGTNVYADPEHSPSQKVSEKSDIYSFGVVLLELITGKKPSAINFNIIEWVRTQIESALSKGKYEDLVDSKLTSYPAEKMKRMIYCAIASIFKPSKFRPKMKEIIEVLEGIVPPEQIWDWEDNKFLHSTKKDNPKANGFHHEDHLQHMVQKPLVTLEANDGIKPREYTYQERTASANGSSINIRETPSNGIENLQDYQPREITYKELITATDGFSLDNFLGEGRSGQVYKGCLSGEAVTVKRFKYKPGEQEDEFEKIKAISSNVHHENLVNLIGYCNEGANRLLVYEFVPEDKTYGSYFRGMPLPLPHLGHFICKALREPCYKLVSAKGKENFKMTSSSQSAKEVSKQKRDAQQRFKSIHDSESLQTDTGSLIWVKAQAPALKAMLSTWNPSYRVFSFNDVDMTPMVEEYQTLLEIPYAAQNILSPP